VALGREAPGAEAGYHRWGAFRRGLISALSIWGGTWSQRAVGGYLEDEFATGLSSRRRLLPT